MIIAFRHCIWCLTWGNEWWNFPVDGAVMVILGSPMDWNLTVGKRMKKKKTTINLVELLMS